MNNYLKLNYTLHCNTLAWKYFFYRHIINVNRHSKVKVLHIGPISHPVVKSVVKCMVITRLSKWFGIELYCVSTNRVSDLAAIEWLRSQRLTTGYLVVMGGDQPRNQRSRKYRGM